MGNLSYKYNGKELDAMHRINLYDYSARFMDSNLGRFVMVDPLSEKYYSWSPYVYGVDNPLRFIDPTGMSLDKYGLDSDNGVLNKIEENEDNFDLIQIGQFNNSGSFQQNKSIEGFKISKGQLNETKVSCFMQRNQTESLIHKTLIGFSSKFWNRSFSNEKCTAIGIYFDRKEGIE